MVEKEEIELSYDVYRRKLLPLPPYQFSIDAVRMLHDIHVDTEQWEFFKVFEKVFKFANLARY
jgi:hypothetical protein